MSLADLLPVLPGRVAAEAAPRFLTGANDDIVGIGWTVQSIAGRRLDSFWC
jgi:hypothetical protein